MCADPTNEDLLKTCANCSILLPLSEPTAVKVAQEAVAKYNRGGGSHPSHMALLEVAHVMTLVSVRPLRFVARLLVARVLPGGQD